MVTTINPADCDRTTVYAGECRNFQDTEWITFDSGRRRSPNAPDGNTWLIDVAYGSSWMRDDQVRNLVRLVPAREVTRSDLPDLYAAYSKVMRSDCGDLTPSDLGPVLDAVVARLNANGGLPTGDRWRRAHEIVEAERDQARRERDEWKARADKWHGAWQKSAPDRTVTREDVEKAVRRGHNMLNAEVGVVNEMCDLLGVEAGQATDPVEKLADEFARDLARNEHIGGAWSMDPADWRDVTLAMAKRAKDVLGQEADR